MKRKFKVSLSALLCLTLLSANCSLIDKEALINEVTECFYELNDKALEEINKDIDILEDQLAIVEDKEDALNEIIYFSEDVVSYYNESVAAEKVENEWYYQFILTAEDCSDYSNEFYEIIEFELTWMVKTNSWNLNRIIVVRDRETGAQGDIYVIETMLNTTKSALIDKRNIELTKKENVNQLLVDVLEHQDEWQVHKIDNDIYSVSGYGLGYTQQLIDGEWYYYQNASIIEPVSSQSTKLRDALTGEL